MNIKSIVNCLFIIMLVGCEADKVIAITDDPINANLFVLFNGATNTTAGTATFWDQTNRKQLIFHSAATLLFQNIRMDYKSSDYSYVKEILNFHSPVTFTITDVNNETFTNSISINSIELPQQYLGIVPDTIDSSQPLTVLWQRRDGILGLPTAGVPLDSGETITLRIEMESVQQTSLGSRSITFTVSDFAKLSHMRGSNVILSIERTKIVQPIPDPMGAPGLMRALYIARPREVYLK